MHVRFQHAIIVQGFKYNASTMKTCKRLCIHNTFYVLQRTPRVMQYAYVASRATGGIVTRRSQGYVSTRYEQAISFIKNPDSHLHLSCVERFFICFVILDAQKRFIRERFVVIQGVSYRQFFLNVTGLVLVLVTNIHTCKFSIKYEVVKVTSKQFRDIDRRRSRNIY